MKKILQARQELTEEIMQSRLNVNLSAMNIDDLGADTAFAEEVKRALVYRLDRCADDDSSVGKALYTMLNDRVERLVDEEVRDVIKGDERVRLMPTIC